MPDVEYHKIKPKLSNTPQRPSSKGAEYAELQVTSNFSFLRGASHPEELVTQAAALGMHSIAISDLNTLAGVVRAHSAAKAAQIPYRVGCRLEISDGTSIIQEKPAFSILVYPLNRQGYGNLCRLLTIGKRRAEKGKCFLNIEDFCAFHQDLAIILIPPRLLHSSSDPSQTNFAQFIKAAERILDLISDKKLLSLALIHDFENNGAQRFSQTLSACKYLTIRAVACNDIYMHSHSRRPLMDVLTCIRVGCSLPQAGHLLFQNSERFLKSPTEMLRLFRHIPDAISRGVEISEMASGFSLDQLKYEYPDKITPPNKPAFEYLIELSWEGARERYQGNIPEKVKKLIHQELLLIHELKYEKYFLTCYDLVKFARSKNILCQGRGAAANSAVCFCLGITSIDPTEIDLLFARFVSRERQEPPDIDIDFEHERREEVIQYIYNKFGREYAGITAEVITYRQRSAIRDVGKALGLPNETVDRLAKLIHRWTRYEIPKQELQQMGLHPEDAIVSNLFTLSQELLGFPRHLSQHVGGFIISQYPLCESVPILNAAMEERTIIEWDKDDIDALGMLKIDVLALGMLTCIRKTLDLVNHRRQQENKPTLQLHNLPAEDPRVYDMICQADTIGVFQIESRAQMSMLPRLKPRTFYDLVIEVAIVRPGPIQGNMVHPFLKRRNGLEKPFYPDTRVKEILGKTLGVPLFQEQAMRLAIVLANFTPDEAEQLRKAIAAWKRDKSAIARFREKVITGMLANGYDLKFAETCIQQMKGFAEYGFPESHAASFALLVYASSCLKYYYPAEFACALLNSQPMGFYAPAQIVRDAIQHGIETRPIDINQSNWDCTLEKIDLEKKGARPFALRLGMRLIKGLQEKEALALVEERKQNGSFSSIKDLWYRVHISGKTLRKASLQCLAKADAFKSVELNARQALWEIHGLPTYPGPLDYFEKFTKNSALALPMQSAQQQMFQDYATTGLSLKAHPLNYLRSLLNTRKVKTAAEFKQLMPNYAHPIVSIAGIAIVRQRPGTAKGVVFITIEDETGIANLILKPMIFDQYQKIAISSSCILAHGKIERSEQVAYLNVQSLESLDSHFSDLKGGVLPDLSYSY